MKCLECGSDFKCIVSTHLKKCCGLTIKEYKDKHQVSFAGTGNAGSNNGRWNTTKIRNCIDCGAPLEKRGRSKRCVPCSKMHRKGKENSFFGKKHTEETRARMKESHRKRDKSTYYRIPQTKEILHKASLTRKKNWAKMSLEEKHIRLKTFIEAGSKLKNKTSIEEKVNDFLVNINMVEGEDYSRNIQIGPYNVDFLLNKEYIIECYGDYWHKHPEEFLEETDERKRQKDSEKKRFLEEKGYKFIYFWERDIQNNMENVINEIEIFLGSFFNVFNWKGRG